MFFLVDYENVGGSGLQGAEYLGREDTVVLFYSGSCEVMQYRYMQAVKENAGELVCVRLKKKRKNAMDMYITVYVGRLMERGRTPEEGGEVCQGDPASGAPDGTDLRIAILSHDRGYESAIEYCEGYGTLPATPCLCGSIEDAILRLDAASERGQKIAELRRRVPIG